MHIESAALTGAQTPVVRTRRATATRGRITVVLVALGLALSACVETASTMIIPEDATAPAPETLVRAYSNRSEDWGRGAGIYYARNGTWRAVNPTEQSVGMGRWYVTTESQVCTEGNWHWRQDFGTTTGDTLTSCRAFRLDGEGQMWSTTDAPSGPWFPFDFDNSVRGDRIDREFTRMIRQLDLEVPTE